MKELIAVICMLAVCIGLVIGLFACSESAGTKRYQEKLAQYEIICINGIDYYTADIVGSRLRLSSVALPTQCFPSRWSWRAVYHRHSRERCRGSQYRQFRQHAG